MGLREHHTVPRVGNLVLSKPTRQEHAMKLSPFESVDLSPSSEWENVFKRIEDSHTPEYSICHSKKSRPDAYMTNFVYASAITIQFFPTGLIRSMTYGMTLTNDNSFGTPPLSFTPFRVRMGTVSLGIVSFSSRFNALIPSFMPRGQSFFRMLPTEKR